MKSHHMRMGLGLALSVTLVAAWFAPSQQDDSVVLTARVDQPQIQQQSSSAIKKSSTDSNNGVITSRSAEKSNTSVQVLKIRGRSYSEDEEMSIFSKASWESPSAVVEVQPVELPPAPTAPALPFRVMGRYVESDKNVIFLLQADQSWAVREGETFAENYKVERIASNAIHLRYIPLNELQVLEMGVAR